MALRFVVQEVNIEDVKKPGGKGYQKAAVVHTYNGRNQTQNIMSFANPQVFSIVKNLKAGDVIDVDITKNDAGYNQWAKVSRAEDGDVVTEPTKTATTGGKVTGSNYETREERAARQVLIVRQSCLAQAVASYGPVVEGTPVDRILERAQQFTFWVFQTPDLFDQPNDLEASE